MKKRFFIKDRSGSNKSVILQSNRPVSSFDFLFDDAEQDVEERSDSWLTKAHRLQARKWRNFKRQAF